MSPATLTLVPPTDTRTALEIVRDTEGGSMSATDRSQEPNRDPRACPTVSVTRYAIISDMDDLADAMSGWSELYALEGDADAELATWHADHRSAFRVVRIAATVSEAAS